MKKEIALSLFICIIGDLYSTALESKKAVRIQPPSHVYIEQADGTFRALRRLNIPETKYDSVLGSLVVISSLAPQPLELLSVSERTPGDRNTPSTPPFHARYRPLTPHPPLSQAKKRQLRARAHRQWLKKVGNHI